MAALSAARNTPQMTGEPISLSIPLAANAKVFEGGLVMVDNTSGYGKAGASGATTNISVGVAKKSVDNTGGSNGAATADVLCEEAFLLDCSGFTQTALGRAVYFTDDHTVTLTATTNSMVGTVVQFVSATQVWVYIGVPRVAGA